jgi:hypothetical protein
MAICRYFRPPRDSDGPLKCPPIGGSWREFAPEDGPLGANPSNQRSGYRSAPWLSHGALARSLDHSGLEAAISRFCEE